MCLGWVQNHPNRIEENVIISIKNPAVDLMKYVRHGKKKRSSQDVSPVKHRRSVYCSSSAGILALDWREYECCRESEALEGEIWRV
jgi:hypothetical protein